ncbi:chorismate synthase [Candidatus Microgenomates bacterium]|nr:chorismate synthase [Candidatus Microgenomates bacterium]
MSSLRFLTAGESHGPAEVAILEGIPAGLSITTEEINKELKKRAHDFGRGGRGKIEADEVNILSGVRFGKTIGSPIALLVENRDSAHWEDKVTKPRPGHADLSGVLKYGFTDVRNVLERASARETVMRVAVGAVCKKFLSEFDMEIASHTLQIGRIRITKNNYTFADVARVFDIDHDTRCIDQTKREDMKTAITRAREEKNTLGGIVEVIAHQVPVGLGSYVHYDRRLDGQIAQALMSIPSVKAVEIGNGIEIAGKTGKEAQDAVYIKDKKITRKTNNMGGIEGGMTNGQDVVVRVFHKPLSTIYDPLPTVDIATLSPAAATVERSDVCIVARAGVISESMLAFVLARAMLEKFGGDNILETKRNFQNYQKSLPASI